MFVRLCVGFALFGAALAGATGAQAGDDCRIDPTRALSWAAFDTLSSAKATAEVAALYVYEGCGRRLVYVAAVHSNDVNSRTFALVKRAFDAHMPQFVVLEGFPTSMGSSPAALIDHSTTVAGTPGDAEPYLGVRLAQAAGVPFAGGEPDDTQVLAYVKAKGMNAGDLFALYVLRQIEQWVREGKLSAHTDPALDERIKRYANAFARDAKVEPREIDAVATAAGFKAWYKKTNALDFDTGYRVEDAWPVTGAFNRPTNRMTVTMSDVRDTHILGVVSTTLGAHARVLIVYGLSHHDIQGPALEAAFGKPKAVVK